MIDSIIQAYSGLGRLSPKIAFVPHAISQVQVMYGLPSFPVVGLDYVFAYYNQPLRKPFRCLTGKGVYVSNRNRSGVIEIGVVDSSPTNMGFEIAQSTGIPFPIAITDRECMVSFVTAASCQLLQTPEWRRTAVPGVTQYTFGVTDLIVSHGMRKLA